MGVLVLQECPNPQAHVALSAFGKFHPRTARVDATGDNTRVYGIHTDELDVRTIQAFEVPAAIRR